MYNIGEALGKLQNPAEFPVVANARLFAPGFAIR
jgi:hypothetical protein